MAKEVIGRDGASTSIWKRAFGIEFCELCRVKAKRIRLFNRLGGLGSMSVSVSINLTRARRGLNLIVLE